MENLTLTAYQTFKDGNPATEHGKYQLQLNPEDLAISYDQVPKKKDEPKTAAGTEPPEKKSAYNKQTVSVRFTIDSSGAIPNLPEEVSSTGGSILDSIDLFLEVTTMPTKETHEPPFVTLNWGSFSCTGKVFGLKINYTYFNITGDPIRAEVSFSLVEEVDEKVISKQWRSPDITRIVTLKEGDTLIGLCESFYEDSKYYLQVATYNNLPSFRGLKIGSQIEFPPLEK